MIREFIVADENQCRRVERRAEGDGRGHHTESRVEGTTGRGSQEPGIAVMVLGVSGVDVGIAILGRHRRVVIRGVAQVGVVEVQAARCVVMIGRLMHVRRSGHETEEQIGGATADGEKSTHPTELSRSHGSALWTDDPRFSRLDLSMTQLYH